MTLMLFAIASTMVAAETESIRIEGDKLNTCKVIDEGNHLASVQWIEGTKTLFIFAKPELKSISLAGFSIHVDETVEVIREKGAEPLMVDTKELKNVAGAVKGGGIVVLGMDHDADVLQKFVIEENGKPIGILKAQGGAAMVENQPAKVKAHGNVFALAVQNGKLRRIFRVPESIPDPEPVSLNGETFTAEPLAADFFKEWQLKIGDRDFVLTARNDGGTQEFEKDGRVYRFLVIGTPDQLRVISEQDSPKRFKEEMLYREMPFDEVNQPHGQNRTTIGAGGIRIVPAQRIEPGLIEKIGERQ